MEDVTGRDILARFVQDAQQTPEDRHSVLGVALLAAGPNSFLGELEALDSKGEVLDSPLISRILDIVDSAQVARVLWDPVGQRLSVERFKSLLKRILGDGVGHSAAYEAMGGAVDFLRRHPGAFLLPKDLLCSLAESPNAQWRIVALKALRHSTIQDNHYLEYVLHALGSDDEEERMGAIHSLGEFMDDRDKKAFQSLDQSLLCRLDRSLESWTDCADPDLRAASETLRARIRVSWSSES